MSTVIGWFLVTCPWSNSNVSRPGYNGPCSIYQYSSMAPRLSGQNCKFSSFLCPSIPKRDLDAKKTTPNIEVWPESLGAMLECWYIERGLLPKLRFIAPNKTKTCIRCLVNSQILFCKRAGRIGVNTIRHSLKGLWVVAIATTEWNLNLTSLYECKSTQFILLHQI